MYTPSLSERFHRLSRRAKLKINESQVDDVQRQFVRWIDPHGCHSINLNSNMKNENNDNSSKILSSSSLSVEKTSSLSFTCEVLQVENEGKAFDGILKTLYTIGIKMLDPVDSAVSLLECKYNIFLDRNASDIHVRLPI